MSKNERVRIWVAPKFKNMLKGLAGQKGKSLEDLTEEIAENFGNFGKKNGFEFKI